MRLIDAIIIGLIIIQVIVVLTAFGCFYPPVFRVHRHDWQMIGKDVHLGGGRVCNIYECRDCGKIKTE